MVRTTAKALGKAHRFELNIKAREHKKKRKHKGLATGKRQSISTTKDKNVVMHRDPRIGSRKKIPLIPLGFPKSSVSKTPQDLHQLSTPLPFDNLDSHHDSDDALFKQLEQSTPLHFIG